MAASIFLKYFIVALVAQNLYQNSLTWEKLAEDLLESSELVVAMLVGSGALIALSGLSFTPILGLPSEILALGYFAFLFWKY